MRGWQPERITSPEIALLQERVPGTTGKVSFLMTILSIIRHLSCCQGKFDFFFSKGMCAKRVELVRNKWVLFTFLRQLPNYV